MQTFEFMLAFERVVLVG